MLKNWKANLNNDSLIRLILFIFVRFSNLCQYKRM
jgi:hypothetical protein